MHKIPNHIRHSNKIGSVYRSCHKNFSPLSIKLILQRTKIWVFQASFLKSFLGEMIIKSKCIYWNGEHLKLLGFSNKVEKQRGGTKKNGSANLLNMIAGYCWMFYRDAPEAIYKIKRIERRLRKWKNSLINNIR